MIKLVIDEILVFFNKIYHVYCQMHTHQIFGKTLMFYLFWGVNFVHTLQVHKGTDGKQV